MMKIDEHLSEFVNLLGQGKAVRCQKDEWYIEKWPQRVFTLEQTRSLEVAKAFNAFLDRQERIPVILSANGAPEQKKKFADLLKASKIIKKKLQANSLKQNQAALKALKRRVVALKYRIGTELGGTDILKKGEIDEQLLQNLTALFQAWKKKQTIYHDQTLSLWEQNILENICQYPKFVKMVLKDPCQQEECFKRLLRDRYGVQEFIEFYSVYKRLEECLLVGWVGRFGKQFFSVETEQVGIVQRKVVALKMEGKKVNILDEKSRVTFDGNLKVDIKTVLNVFKAKNDEPGDFAVFGPSGVTRFNAHVHDRYNPATKKYDPIDLTQPNSAWWEKYPVFETVDRAELIRRHPQVINKEGQVVEANAHLNSGQWLVIEKASKESPGLDLDANHGYLDIYIPSGPDQYTLVTIGKFARKFPRGFFGRLKFIMGTFESRLAFGDENHCYFRRQHASVAYLAAEGQGKKLMELIRLDILASRANNLVFQFSWQNCSQWAYHKLIHVFGKEGEGGVVKNNYEISVLNLSPSNPLLKKLIKIVASTPKKIQSSLIKSLLFLFGSFRKMETLENGEIKTTSMVKVLEKMREVKIYLPGYLHHKIKEGTVIGTLSVGPFVQA
ncbi:hypothetical protein [Parachlamydia sp. AcF125]|uniref:hypothetical protein n=1 Tax=Parachlamydia sp. AcF125 TaxID=2795736 RepID=UPI001BC987A2|nr:hypothetical protein [Parachlamydia sp. AcF125]MBS4168761.1 hypothetical protein [Parachlamydia sp. AcF125]